MLFAYASLEYYLKYIYYFCLQKDPYEKGRNQILDELKHSDNERAIKTHQYIGNHVFKSNKKEPPLWGNKLNKLRNFTAHEKLVEIGTIQRKNLLQVTREEPALEGQQIAHYLESKFAAHSMLMFIKMNSLLYDIPWVPGPFHERIYD